MASLSDIPLLTAKPDFPRTLLGSSPLDRTNYNLVRSRTLENNKAFFWVEGFGAWKICLVKRNFFFLSLGGKEGSNR